jgi:hypothetical protein
MACISVGAVPSGVSCAKIARAPFSSEFVASCRFVRAKADAAIYRLHQVADESSSSILGGLHHEHHLEPAA